MKILAMNAGSSSLKASLWELGDTLPDVAPQPLWEAQTDVGESREEAFERLLGAQSSAGIDIAGHRVVHGGHEYLAATLVTPEVEAAITRLAAFAPLHNIADLEGIRLAQRMFPGVPQIAVFDTAFHATLPLAASVYPGPYEWVEQGIRRYGFHGINHQYCAARAAQLLGRDVASLRIITCHLGSGCSLAAINGGVSVDTTMGFTPLEGLMMGTRSGSIDPGILFYLQREHGSSTARLEQILNHESGLLGVSGVSSDMRRVLAAAEGNTRAKLAFDIFVHRLRSAIGAMLASLGGVDALVFTGGIGEHSADVRAAACADFRFLGLELDAAKNSRVSRDTDISSGASSVRILVVSAKEEWAIARECWQWHQSLG